MNNDGFLDKRFVSNEFLKTGNINASKKLTPIFLQL
jgi:hypothetical protein